MYFDFTKELFVKHLGCFGIQLKSLLHMTIYMIVYDLGLPKDTSNRTNLETKPNIIS